MVSLGQARGAALADFNLDGLLDLIEVNRSDNVRVWRNLGVGEAGEPEPLSGWLALDLQQRGSNVDAIGAWVEVKAGGDVIRRQVTVGGGHAGGKLGWVHVGLGDEQTPQVRIVWPDGEVGQWLDVNANQFVQIERGAEQPVVWIPS